MNASNRKPNFTLNLAQWGISKAKGLSRTALVLSLVALVMGAYPTLPALAASGDLDTTFSGNGKVTTSFNGSSAVEAHAVAVQSNGKIVAAGWDYGIGRGDFALARYNTDGTLDAAFGNNGVVTTGFPNNTRDSANALAIQSNDKIVVVGSSINDNTFDSYFALARYNTDGTLDTTFGGNGKVWTGFGGSGAAANAVAIQPNGKIVVAGEADFTSSCGNNCSYTSAHFALARYNTDGTLDTTFSVNGKVWTDFGGSEEASALAIQPNGKIVVAGYSKPLSDDWDFILARYNSDGSLDTSFSYIGVVSTDFGGGTDAAFAVALQTDGKIVAAGKSWNTNSPSSPEDSDFALVRYTYDGALDTTFSGNGKVITASGGDEEAHALVIQPNGKIVAAGVASNIGQGDFALARYNADGTLDTTFSGDGKAFTGFGSYDDAYALAIQANGKLVAAGGTSNGFALARYLP